MLLMQKIFGTKDVILQKENSARLGSLLKVWKLGSARLAGQKARLGSARQKVGSEASLETMHGQI